MGDVFADAYKANKFMAWKLVNNDNAKLPDVAGNYPLHIAATHDDVFLIQLLLSKDADPNVANRDLMTPLQIAITKNSIACVAILLKHGAKWSIRTVQMAIRGHTGIDVNMSMIGVLQVLDIRSRSWLQFLVANSPTSPVHANERELVANSPTSSVYANEREYTELVRHTITNLCSLTMGELYELHKNVIFDKSETTSAVIAKCVYDTIRAIDIQSDSYNGDNCLTEQKVAAITLIVDTLTNVMHYDLTCVFENMSFKTMDPNVVMRTEFGRVAFGNCRQLIVNAAPKR